MVARAALAGLLGALALAPGRLPAPVYRTVAVAAAGKVYVLGGHDAAGATIDGVEVFDPASGRARHAGTLALPTHGAAAADVGGRILVFGGASIGVRNAVQQFDPATGRARVVGALPGPRADVTAAVVGGSAVLVGGFDGYGPQSPVWETRDGRRFAVVAHLRQAVRYAAVAPLGDAVYVFGGLISGGEYDGTFSDAIQRVDLRHGSVRIVGRLPTPLAHAMAAVVGARVYVLGGSAPGGPSDAVRRFDPATGRVRTAGRLPRPLTDGGVAVVGPSIYLLGGMSTSGPVRAIERIRPAP